MMEIILGSRSPRRKEILDYFSLPFRQADPEFDEDQVPFLGDPAAFAKSVAFGKAATLNQKYPAAVILTADTVVYANDRLYLKPQTLAEARQMLRELSGKQHKVFTGVCVCFKNMHFSDVEKTVVEFCQLTDSEIHAYAEAFSPLDKAGGYAIQKSGCLIVKRIEGCYYNVMGLPLQKVRQLLLNVGIDLWDYFKSV